MKAPELFGTWVPMDYSDSQWMIHVISYELGYPIPSRLIEDIDFIHLKAELVRSVSHMMLPEKWIHRMPSTGSSLIVEMMFGNIELDAHDGKMMVTLAGRIFGKHPFKPYIEKSPVKVTSMENKGWKRKGFFNVEFPSFTKDDMIKIEECFIRDSKSITGGKG